MPLVATAPAKLHEIPRRVWRPTSVDDEDGEALESDTVAPAGRRARSVARASSAMLVERSGPRARTQFAAR
jgi:hypothetical protein